MNKEINRNVQLIFGFIILLFLGVAYAWSIFVSPLEAVFGWKRDQTSMIFTLSMICFCLGGIIAGKVNQRINHRILFAVMAIVMLIGFVYCGNVKELIDIYLAYGVVCGFCIGFSYNIIISNINKWFLDKIGFASGILMMGYGLGSLLLGPIVGLFINNIGIQNTFYCLGIIFCGLLMAGALFIRVPRALAIKTERFSDRKEYTTRMMLGSIPFYIYYLWGVSVSSVGMSVIGHASPIAEEIGMKNSTILIVSGMLSIGNGISRLVFGYLYDLLGRKRVMLMISISLLFGIGMLYIGNMKSNFVIVSLAFLCIGCAYGGSSPCNSAFVKEFYGEQYYGQNFSVSSSTGIIASFIGPYIVGVILEKTYQYRISFQYLLGFAVAALILQFILTIMEKRK